MIGLHYDLAHGESTFPEYQLKALYVVNFGHYTRWPDDSPRNSMKLCIIGHFPFQNYFSTESLKKFPIKKKIIVERLEVGAQLDDCQVVFISEKEQENLIDILLKTKGKPILTVGESTDFIDQGGIIYLKIVKETVKFEINLEAQRDAGIVLSSRLLALASKVYE